jgi:hypothetical protein
MSCFLVWGHAGRAIKARAPATMPHPPRKQKSMCKAETAPGRYAQIHYVMSEHEVCETAWFGALFDLILKPTRRLSCFLN